MKGFPNQIADFSKLSRAVETIRELADAGDNPRDDRILGEALVRAEVLGTGHSPKPVDQYLREQRSKPRSHQSFQAAARGLRELFRLFGLIDESSGTVLMTVEGRRAAAFGGEPLDAAQIDFWRRVVRNCRHYGSDTTASHPYQVMLRLIARSPGITRAKCALALEAKDDSAEELERIVQLSRLTEEQICSRLGVSPSNWENAKKVLPRFAEQLGDVTKDGRSYTIANAPGTAGVDAASTRSSSVQRRQPRTSREVTPETIGTAGIAERDEPAVSPSPDPHAAAAATRLRAERLRRHNTLVRVLATRLAGSGLTLFEDPYDILGVRVNTGVLGEIKTLDGSIQDERDRVRDALAQLLYYEAFLITPEVRSLEIHKIACFERPITEEHQRWLNQSRIGVLWLTPDGDFAGDPLAYDLVGQYLELR